MSLDNFFNGNSMFPSSKEFADYLGFPIWEEEEEVSNKEKEEKLK